MLHTPDCREQNKHAYLYKCVCHAMHVKYEAVRAKLMDEVNHPTHYTSHPSGVQFVEIAETMTFNLGSALKYIWRCGLKSDDVVKDLKKAVWYLNREIGRLQKLNGEEDKPEEHRTAVTPTINGLGEAPGELAARFHSGG